MKQQEQHKAANLDAALGGADAGEGPDLRALWNLMGDQEPTALPEPDKVAQVWQALNVAASSDTRSPSPRPPTPSGGLRRMTGPRWQAAAVVLLVGVAVGLWALWPRSYVAATAPGERLSVQLPDGSHVELNSGSTLRYARRFADERVVYLEGEAFFDVVEEDRPFIVHTFNAQVSVLGTRFNVRAWQESMDPGTTLALASGRVALAPRERLEEAVVLTPGQVHRIADEASAPPPPDTLAVADASSWQQGDLVFKDQWLGVILEDIGRRFAIEVSLLPRSLRQERLTSAWRNPASAEDVIRDVCAGLGLSYRETSVGYEMYRP